MTESKTIFQLVRRVLDELKADVAEAYGKKADAAITAQLANLSKAYGDLRNPDRPPVDYSAPENRFAYVYRYVGAHSDYVYQILGSARKLMTNELTAREKIVVACLGGGPGSELVGLMQYLSELEDCNLKTVTAYLCDREQAWADCWTEIGEEVPSDFHLNVNFQPLDVTNPESWAKQRKFLSADLFMLVYFASEIAGLGSKSEKFWGELSARAREGAYMLIVDNDHSFFSGFIESSIIGKTWKVIQKESTYLTPSFREEKTDLGPHDLMAFFGPLVT